MRRGDARLRGDFARHERYVFCGDAGLPYGSGRLRTRFRQPGWRVHVAFLLQERFDCGADWTFFDETAFALTPSGNGGKRAFPYFETELTPKHDATGIEANFDWNAAAPEVRIRAIVEGQIANMRERTRWIGDFKTIYVTGGASRSKGILATIREIFGADARTLEVSDSAALGGALLAARAIETAK